MASLRVSVGLTVYTCEEAVSYGGDQRKFLRRRLPGNIRGTSRSRDPLDEALSEGNRHRLGSAGHS